MVTTYAWADIRDRAIQAFNGETCGAETENAIIGIFERRPAMVVSELERVANDYAAGRAQSGWAVLKARLVRMYAASDIVVTDETEQRNAIRRAEQWMRAAGKHLPTQAELEDALFGELGPLHRFADDTALRTRMFTLYADVRPEGELIDQQAEERAQRNSALRAKLRSRPANDDIPL